MFEGRAGMDDDLEALLAADEAAIKDGGFASRVVDHAHDRSRFRRGWLTAAGLVGLCGSVISMIALSGSVEAALEAAAPAQFVLSLPVVDLSFQMNGDLLMPLGLGLAMLLAIAATRFASDDF